MSDVQSSMHSKQLEKETAALRSYIRQMNASVEVYKVLKDQFKISSQQWMIDEILSKKKRVLSQVQEVILKRDDTVEDTVPWFSVITTNYFKCMSKLTFDQHVYIIDKLYCIERKLSDRLVELMQHAYSEKVKDLVQDMKKTEGDIMDGLSVLKNLNSPCNDE
ncbi:hypothetical protein TDB9533_02481 [Thalassocella blandensis]|nr:hypothetical protein TDB9533_02481 [Thalassocella blandensis]